MRLLDVESLIYGGAARLIECNVSQAPPYAILSHTWSSEEVLFQDVALGPDYDLHETPTPDQPKPTLRESLLAHLYSERSAICEECKLKKSGHTNLYAFCYPSKPSAISEKCKLKQSGHSSSLAPKLLGRPKAGWNKVANACLRACKDGYRYIWIDTCCIDKSSSAELSEAINSMFEWYARSSVCYVYLEDCVDCPLWIRKDGLISWISDINPCMIAQLRTCKWLTRGWTLQELIAPKSITFVDKNWVPLFERFQVQHILHDITGIARGLFDNRQPLMILGYEDDVRDLRKRLRQLSVVERMSWIGARKTTRSEDIAYCLLGIFGVNLPLLYGEGERAFGRLQDAIMKVNVDQTILAWECNVPAWSDTTIYKDMLLAPDPRHFYWWRSFKRYAQKAALSIGEPFITGSMKFPESFELTNAGLQISLRCLDASTIRRSIAERIYKLSHNDVIDEDGSSENVGSNESSGTEYNGTSTIVNDDNGTTDSDQDEAYGSHEDGVSCALLDCELEVGLTKYAIAIQLQHTQAGDRYRVSAAVGENLFKHGDYPHRLLFVKAEAVEGAKRRAMLIRHDYTAWYLF